MSRIPRLITLTETLTKPDITKTESNNCFIEHCFKENTVLIVACADPSLTLLLEIMHCAGNEQISRLYQCIIIRIIIRSKFFFLFIGREPTT